MSEKDLLQENGRAGYQNRLGERQNVKLVHERVRRAILSGEIPAGNRLSQVRLAERLGVSRIPLREALRLLEHEGLIESEVNQRVRVAGLSVVDFEQLYAMRIGLEVLGVRLTVPRLVEEDLRELDGKLAQMEEFAKVEDFEGWEVPHRAFHAGLVARAGDRLFKMISQLYDHAERYRRAYMSETPHTWSWSTADHEFILDACKARDPDAAAQRLARHYSEVALSLIAKLAPEHDPVAVRTALRLAMAKDDLATSLSSPRFQQG